MEGSSAIVIRFCERSPDASRAEKPVSCFKLIVTVRVGVLGEAPKITTKQLQEQRNVLVPVVITNEPAMTVKRYLSKYAIEKPVGARTKMAEISDVVSLSLFVVIAVHSPSSLFSILPSARHNPLILAIPPDD